jgi:hypothetical protein
MREIDEILSVSERLLSPESWYTSNVGNMDDTRLLHFLLPNHHPPDKHHTQSSKQHIHTLLLLCVYLLLPS